MSTVVIWLIHLKFQFTHPWRCDNTHVKYIYIAKCFNSRTREGATPTEMVVSFTCSVSIHAPVKVRRRQRLILCRQSRFNSRTREGATQCTSFVSVSITSFNSRTCEGATSRNTQYQQLYRVSIHAPVKVRRHVLPHLSNFLEFQFTHPWRCDVVGYLVLVIFVSFNSRTREGATR